MMLLIAGVAVVFIGVVVTGVVFAFSGKSSSGKEPIATVADPTAPGAGGPAAGAPAPGVDPAGAVPAEMSAVVLRQVKQSTVYLRVRMAGGVAEGSGFFAVERGIIITNAHVIGMLRAGSRPPGSVEVVVNSGDVGEVKTTASVLGVDRDNDLAVLRVAGDSSTPAAALAGRYRPRSSPETQKVCIFGFPLWLRPRGKASIYRGHLVLRKLAPARAGRQRSSRCRSTAEMHPGNSWRPRHRPRAAWFVGVFRGRHQRHHHDKFRHPRRLHPLCRRASPVGQSSRSHDARADCSGRARRTGRAFPMGRGDPPRGRT